MKQVCDTNSPQDGRPNARKTVLANVWTASPATCAVPLVLPPYYRTRPIRSLTPEGADVV